MVLAKKIGKRRSLGSDVLLYVVTFGIYGWIWNYKAHAEIYKQFDLLREDRDEGFVWMILGMVLFPPLFWVYQHGFLRNVNAVRSRFGLPEKVRSGKFLGIEITGSLVFVVGLVLLFIGVTLANIHAGDLITLNDGTLHIITQSEADRAHSRATPFWTGGLAAMTLGAGLVIWAYALLQRTINDVWDAYDARMGRLTQVQPFQS